jgi:hypothetical protein
MDRLRVPFFLVAVAAIGLVVLLELGAALLLGGADASALVASQAADAGVSVPPGQPAPQPTGIGIRYLVLVDIVALFTVALMGAGLVLPDRLHGRIQGIATIVASIILIVVALGLLLVAIAELVLMVTLLLAVPFGTIAYLIVWGSFPRGDAAVLLSLLMFLKLAFAGALVLAQQRFLQNKGLVALVATSLVANVVVAFLHGAVPGILVSITDSVAGVVLAVAAIIWAIVLLVGAVPGVAKVLKARPA